MSARSRIRNASTSSKRFALGAASTLALGLFTAFTAPAYAQDEYCPSGTVECADGCIPSGAVCCGSAGYCDAGEYCTTTGCATSGGSDPDPGYGECPSGYQSCADGCIPSGAVCCGSAGYCDAGEYCTGTGCATSGGSEPDPGSSECPSGYQGCADGCIPLGAVCCGYEGYCDAGEYCTDTGCASEGSSEPTPGVDGADCASGYEPCYDGCMPLGGVCCGAPGYCDAGEVCADTGCLSEGDADPDDACAAGSYECADASGCCPNGTLCGTGAGDCGADSCCSTDDPSVPATSLPLFPMLEPSEPNQPIAPTGSGTTTSMEGGFTCAGQELDGCDVKYCANFETNQSYYTSDGVRFACASASDIGGCLQSFADYCATKSGTSSPSTNYTPSSSSSTESDYSDDDDDSACSVAPRRTASSSVRWAFLAPLAWLAARRRRLQAR